MYADDILKVSMKITRRILELKSNIPYFNQACFIVSIDLLEYQLVVDPKILQRFRKSPVY